MDLVFPYPEAGETDGRRSIPGEEYFTRLGQLLIRLLDAPTVDGFVYRVDMRLRPFGDSGPLVASFGAFEDYLQQHGRDWERYAYVKARAVTAGGLNSVPGSKHFNDLHRRRTANVHQPADAASSSSRRIRCRAPRRRRQGLGVQPRHTGSMMTPCVHWSPAPTATSASTGTNTVSCYTCHDQQETEKHHA